MPKKGRGGLRRVLKWFCAVLGAIVILAVLVRAALLHYAEKDVARVKAKLSFELVPSRDLATLWGPEPSSDENASPLYIEANEKLSAILYPDDGKGSVASHLIEQALCQEEPVQVPVAELLASACEEGKQTPYDQLQNLLGIWGLQEYEGEQGPGAFASLGLQENGEQEASSATSESLPARDVAAARTFLAQFTDVLRIRDEAVRRPWCCESLDWNQPRLAKQSDGYVNRLSDLTDITLLESAVAAHELRWEEAYGKVCAVLVMAQHLEQVHLLDKQLCTSVMRRKACEQLARLLVRSCPSSDVASRLRLLLTFDARQRVRAMIVSEAAFTNGLFEGETSWGILGSLFGEGAAGARLDRFANWAMRPSLIRQHARVLETMNAYYDATGDAAAWQSRCEALDRDFSQLSRHYAWQGPMSVQCPGKLYYFIADSYVQTEALGAMAIVALDVAAFRESGPCYPASLSELPGCDGPPKDPFSGKGLLYRPMAGGSVLWAIGPDGDDDGGVSSDELGSDLLSDGDVVLRILVP
ncbi:MAG TPA: hypothetical protein PLP01_01195 [Phycisphaerae bacterium]|nr:hypothetical protein [Phycisphaerae bacterium]